MKNIFFAVVLFFWGNSCCEADGFITTPPTVDGFGAQLHVLISSVLYADLNQMEFRYTPFSAMEHNYENDPDFLEKKEWLVNFIGNYKINENSEIQRAMRFHVDFLDRNMDACANSPALKKMRSVFRLNKNRSDYFAEDFFNIALHIRRPNPHDSRVTGTDTPDEIYLNTIEKLRSVYYENNPLFHIYSQGDIDSFKAIYQGDDILFHINASVEETFTSMVLADALVISRSALSYTAGILSEGTVYYFPFWHSPLPGWIPYLGF